LEVRKQLEPLLEAPIAVLEVRKQLEPLLEAPKNSKTKTEEDEQKKMLSAIKEELKITCKFAGAETLKAYELFHYFFVGELWTQWDKIVQEIHCKDPCVSVNGQLHKGLCVNSTWASFKNCIKLHKLTVFPADTTEKQRFYIKQTIKKPRCVTVCQYMSCMGVLNDNLANLPTVYDLSLAVEGTKKCNVPFN
jgi:hypothetical protein